MKWVQRHISDGAFWKLHRIWSTGCLIRLWNISYIIFGKIHRISFILRIESFNEKLYLKPNHGNILFHVNFFVLLFKTRNRIYCHTTCTKYEVFYDAYFFVNVTKSVVFCEFGYIYWNNSLWKCSFLCVQCTIIADKVNWLYVFEVKDYGYKFLKRSLEMQFEKSVIFQVTIFCQRLHAVLNSKSKSCLRYNGGFRLPEPPALALTVSGVPQAIHHRSSSCFEQYQ